MNNKTMENKANATPRVAEFDRLVKNKKVEIQNKKTTKLCFGAGVVVIKDYVQDEIAVVIEDKNVFTLSLSDIKGTDIEDRVILKAKRAAIERKRFITSLAGGYSRESFQRHKTLQTLVLERRYKRVPCRNLKSSWDLFRYRGQDNREGKLYSLNVEVQTSCIECPVTLGLVPVSELRLPENRVLSYILNIGISIRQCCWCTKADCVLGTLAKRIFDSQEL